MGSDCTAGSQDTEILDVTRRSSQRSTISVQPSNIRHETNAISIEASSERDVGATIRSNSETHNLHGITSHIIRNYITTEVVPTDTEIDHEPNAHSNEEEPIISHSDDSSPSTRNSTSSSRKHSSSSSRNWKDFIIDE